MEVRIAPRSDERSAWIASFTAAGCWGVSLWGADLGVFGALGALALGAVIRGTASDPARIAIFAVGWQALALAWFPDTWADFGGPGGRAAMGVVVALAALPWITALGLASAAVAGGAPRGLALGLGLAFGTALADWTFLPIVPAHLAVSGPGLAWPAQAGGREVYALALGALAGFAWERPVPAVGLGLGWLAAGALWLRTPQPSQLRVGVAETGLDAFQGGAEQREARSRAAVAELAGADLIVLPESAWPRRTGLAALTAVPLLAGVDADRQNALVASAGGREIGRFAKQILVPGSERSVLGLGRDRVRPGTGARALSVPVGDRTLRVVPLICYEDLFARALHDARRGDLLVAVANDGWNRRAAWAHLAATRLAAVETGRWAVRSTPSGISAVIDPRGRLAWSTAAETQVAARSAIVGLGLPDRPGLPYLPAGWLAGAALVGTALAVSSGPARRRRT